MIYNCFVFLIIILIITFLIYKKNYENNNKENFGELSNLYLLNNNADRGKLLNEQSITTKELIDTVENRNKITDIKNPNLNTLNNLPYLINPENPNKGYYFDKVKLITNKNSPLLKKADENMKKINKKLKICQNKVLNDERNNVKGYNNWVDLSKDSYANITSIGKSLLVPYTSFPVPS